MTQLSVTNYKECQKILLLCCHGHPEACQKFSRIGNMLSYHVYAHCREYLIEPIDMEKSFDPSPELRSYIEKARKKEKHILEEYQIAMSQITWT